MLRTAAIILALLAAHPLHAGAWLRPEGESFLILSQERNQIGQYRDQYSKLYAEYGLTSRFTLGAELGHSATADAKEATVFLRMPVGAPKGTHYLSTEFGVGYSDFGPVSEPILRSALSWGRGFDGPLGVGWANVDLIATQRVRTGKISYKTDLTLGLDLRPQTKLILQLQSGMTTDSATYSRFTPSLTYELRPGFIVEIGARVGLTEENSQGLKLGTWLRF